MRLLDLFSGIGGFHYAADQVWENVECVGHVEIDPFCQKVLRKHWPDVPIYSDIKELNGTQFKEVDLLTAGVPCQPASCAGKQGGTEDDRWLWPETFRIIQETKPRWIILENVPGILTLENGVVFESLLVTLEDSGYEVETPIIPACAIDAPHRRDRIWIVAYDNGKFRSEGKENKPFQQSRYGKGVQGNDVGNSESNNKYRNRQKPQQQQVKTGGSGSRSEDVADTESGQSWQQTKPERGKDTCGGSEKVGDISNTHKQRLEKRKGKDANGKRSNSGTIPIRDTWWTTEPDLGDLVDGLPSDVVTRLLERDGARDVFIPRIATGIPDRVNKLKALGNAIVPQCVMPIMQAIKEIDFS